MKAVAQTALVTLLVLAALGGAGYYVIQNMGTPEAEVIAGAAEQAERSIEENTSPPAKEVGLSETEVQIKLHQMTHQKITATEKRGAIEMSPENIANLLTIVQANRGHFAEGDFYENTLLSWQDGDFSNAVAVHNTIWDWHNGTVGKATGFMSAEEEAAYVERHFK